MSDRSVGIDFVARDEVSGVIRTLRSEIAGLQTSLAESTVALARGNVGAIQSMDYLRQRIAGVTSEMETLQAVMSRNTGMTIKIPGLDQQSDIIASTKSAEKWLTTLKTLTELNFPDPLATSFKPNVDQLIRDAQAQEQAINRGIAAAEKEIAVTQRVTQAQKELDLQRRLIVASEIGAGRQKSNEQSYQESVKSIQDASREWDKVMKAEDAAAIAASRGYQQATIEIEKQAQAAQRLKNIDLERRLDVAQQLAGWRQLTPEQQKASQAAGRLTTAIKGASDETRVLQREGRHVVALFDELARNQRGQMVSTLGSMLRDSGVGAGGLMAGLGGIAAIGIVSTVVRSLHEWNTEITELAEKQTNFAAAVGMSAGRFSDFSAAMKLVGGNADTAARSLETIQKRMEDAVQNPASGPASAFLQLGLDWAELKKQLENPGGVENILRQLANEYVRLGNTAERTAIFMQIAGGREQLAQLIPIIRNGAAGMDALFQKASQGNQHFAANIDKLTEMAGKIHKLSLAWEDFKAHIVSSDLFGKELENLTNIVKELNGVKAFDWGRLSPAVQLGRMFGFFKDPINMPQFGGTGGDTNQILRDRQAGDTGAGLSGGGALLSDPMNKLATVDRQLADTFEKTTTLLGYRVGVTGGHATKDHVAGSQHYTNTGAIDFNIYDSNGNSFDHKSAKTPGSPGWQAYTNFGEAFKKLSPGAGRSGMDFNDPGHVDFGLINGAPPGRLAGRLQSGMFPSSAGFGTDIPNTAVSNGPTPVPGFDIGASTKLYEAQIKYNEEVAKSLHKYAELNALLQKRKEFDAADPVQRNNILLQQATNLTKEQAERNTAMLGTMQQQWTANKDQANEAQKIALAQNQSREIQARGREDAKELVTLAEQHSKIVSSNRYNDEAQKIEAANTILQAKINLEKQDLQTLERIISTQAQISDSIIKQTIARNEAAIEVKGGSHASAYQADIDVIKQQYSLQTNLIQKEIELAQAKKDTTLETKATLQLLTTIEAEQTRIVEVQKKMAEEVKAANEKAVAPLKSFFSSAGGAFETFLDAGISKTETFKKAAQQLVTSLTKDLVKGVGGVISEKIAGEFGGKAGEGISGLLADKLGSLLNLTKAVPKATGDAALSATSTSLVGSLNLLNGAVLKSAGILSAHGAATSTDTTATAAGSAVKTTSSGVEQSLTGAKILDQTATSGHTTQMLVDTAAVSANASAQGAAAAGGAASGIGGLLKMIPFVGGFFQQGGIVPSAAGGMVVGGGSGGQLSVLHPREMVLPEHISTGIQAMIHRGGVGTSTGGATLNYNANVTGYHPYASRSSFESMLRTHGGAMRSWVDGMARNRAFG